MPKYLSLDVATPMARLFGRRLRELRRRVGFSQTELFERSRVTPSYISSIENGRANPSLNVMIDLCAALGAQIHVLLTPPTEEEQHWLEAEHDI